VLVRVAEDLRGVRFVEDVRGVRFVEDVRGVRFVELRARFVEDAERGFVVLVVFVRRRRAAAALACRDSACFEAAARGSRFSRSRDARRRLAEGRGTRVPFPISLSRCAERRVVSLACPALGVGNGTPARRALDNPIAMACLVERAPCFPRRMWSISSCTNSPAAVLALLPRWRSRWAFSIVFFSGMISAPDGSRSRVIDSRLRLARRAEASVPAASVRTGLQTRKHAQIDPADRRESRFRPFLEDRPVHGAAFCHTFFARRRPAWRHRDSVSG
jgi:hypothetical protein